MTFSLSDILPHLLVSLDERELVALIRLISKRFTSERERVGQYVQEERQVSAYSAYFLPTNIPKLHFLLDQLGEEIRSVLKEAKLVDIGSGPGTYTLAWRKYFDGQTAATLIDRSPIMLKQAELILDALAPGKTDYRLSWSGKAGENTVALFGNSLNEMGATSGLRLVKEMGPDFIILLEPGTKQAFKEILSFRKNLLLEGYEVHYPCPLEARCPLEGKENWCHQVLRTTHSLDLERLSQLVQLDRKVMPLTAHLYAKKNRLLKRRHRAHFLRFLNETKFSFLWQVCVATEKQEHQIKTFEILKKDYPRPLVKELQNLSVGMSFDFRIKRELEQATRIQLLKVGEKEFTPES